MRVGVIGVGSMGRNHARVLSEMPGIDLIGVCDTNRETADQIAEQFRTSPFYNPQDLLKQGLDAVHVVVPTFIHHEVAIEAINLGAHVLIEKPIADTVEHAREIIRTANKMGVTLMVGHIERFNPAIGKLKEMIAEGYLGNLVSISTLRVAPYPARIVDTGIIIDLGCHDIDIMSYIANERIREVYCTASSTIHHYEDTASISLGFESGGTGNIETSWLSNIKARKLFATFENGFVLVDFIDQSLILYDDNSAREIPVVKSEPLKEEIKEFYKCIREGIEPHIGGDASVHALGIALAAVASSQAHLPVTIHGNGAMDFLPEMSVNGGIS